MCEQEDWLDLLTDTWAADDLGLDQRARDRLVSFASGSAALSYLLGRSFERRGELEVAVRHLSVAIDIGVPSDEMLRTYFNVAFRTADPDVVLAASLAGRTYRPDETWWRWPLTRALEAVDPLAAGASYEQMIREEQDLDFAFAGLARLAVYAGDWARVLDICEASFHVSQQQAWWKAALKQADETSHARLEAVSPVRSASRVSKTLPLKLAIREASMIDFLGSNGIPVPRIIEKVDTASGVVDLVTERIDGVHLWDLYREEDPSACLPHVREMATTLRRLHDIDINCGFGPIDSADQLPKASASEIVKRDVRKLTMLLFQPNVHPAIVRLRGLIRYLEELLAYEGNPKVCHGDFHPFNIILSLERDDAAIRGVLDFESARAFDPMWDLGIAIASLDAVREWPAEFLDAYASDLSQRELLRMNLFRAMQLSRIALRPRPEGWAHEALIRLLEEIKEKLVTTRFQ